MLESEGAEFLVCGQLLIEGILTYKTYTRMPGYDLVAINPERGSSARIQVKSRWATDYGGGFLLKNFDCDFVVHVALNRGYRKPKKKHGDDDGKREPYYYVFPIAIARAAQSAKSTWGKVFKRNMEEPEQYRDRWGLIRDFLEKDRIAH